MKVCILGEKSYICSKLVKYCEFDNIEFESISVRDDKWLTIDFGIYAAVICPIGIAHVSTKPSMESYYYTINRDLPCRIADKVKYDGCKKFIFFSSMIVYGNDLPLGKRFVIKKQTLENPENFYGMSKLEAEEKLKSIGNNDFEILILRLPMVYGPNCKGNFPRLLKLVSKVHILPDIDNSRSMIYIDNLCEFIKLCLFEYKAGTYWPQNSDYISTNDILMETAKLMNKKIIFTKIFNPLIKLLSKKIGIINRIYGTKVYDLELSNELERYNKVNFQESMEKCVSTYMNKGEVK